MTLKSMISKILSDSPLQNFPVKVKKGLAKGMRWTLLPFSSNWREGGEEDLQVALRICGNLLGKTCWDLGAHFGIHTLGLAKAVGSSGQVCSFEPDPVAYSKLTKHVRINQLGWVKPFNAAVSDSSGKTEMLVTGGLGSTFTHLRYDDEPISENESKIRITTVTLDEMVQSGEIRAPDLIKVDVQGHGAKALRGADKSIEKQRPVIVFSCHCQPEAEFLGELVNKLDYQCLNSDGEKADIKNLDHTASYILVPNQRNNQYV